LKHGSYETKDYVLMITTTIKPIKNVNHLI